jgi:hypothetical protein
VERMFQAVARCTSHAGGGIVDPGTSQPCKRTYLAALA